MASTYVFIDTALIGHPLNKPWIKKRRKPSWVAALYEREAIAVSPILIDIERAIICNQLDTMMGLINAVHPQLGISFIDTELTLKQLQEHLRQFTYVRAENDEELTLRFADCAVLPALSTCLTEEQWASLVTPFQNWKIHGRDGKLKSLPICRSDVSMSFPLSLSNNQIASLKEAMSVDQLLANLRKLRPKKPGDYATLKAHEYAQQARQIWLSAGHKEDAELLLFARDVFDTNGRLLRVLTLQGVLQQADPSLRRKDLDRLVSLNLNED